EDERVVTPVDERGCALIGHGESIAQFARTVVNARVARARMPDLHVRLGSHVPDTRRMAEVLPVNKGELVESIASGANLSKTDAESALNAFISSVQSAVADGDKVTLPGFGTFAPSARQARTGMNPQTREPIQIAASKTVKFTVGSDFKKRVNS